MQRYLVIQLARFGDLLQTKRLLASMENGQQNEVHLLVDASLQEMAVSIYPNVHVHGIRAHGGKQLDPGAIYQSNRDILSLLTETPFDRIYNLNYSGMNFALAAMFEPDRVSGYRWKDGQPLRPQWASLAFRWTGNRRRAGINLMDFWAGYAKNRTPPEKVNPIAAPGGRGLGVVLAGRHARRSLPPSLLAALIPVLVSRLDSHRITLLGTEMEKPAARDFMRHLPARLAGEVLDLTGKTRLVELSEVVGGLDVLLTPDTGTMHLAAHLGVPVDALFLSSAWCFETGPYGKGHRIFQATTDCSPCVESTPCPMGRACLEPFADKRFYRYVSGRMADGPGNGVTVYRTGFDQLGVTCRVLAGDDPDSESRRSLRHTLIRYQEGEKAVDPKEHGFDIYQERDWMLSGTRTDAA